MGRETLVREAISELEIPSAASRTIRTRWARPAATVEDRVSGTRVSRSPSRNVRAAIRMRNYLKPTLSTDFRHAPLAPTEFGAVDVDRDLDHLGQVLTVIRAERRRIHNLVILPTLRLPAAPLTGGIDQRDTIVGWGDT